MKQNEKKQAGSNQTAQRTTRPSDSSVPKERAYARLPDNNEDPQKLRGLLRSQHDLSYAEPVGEGRIREKRMEPRKRTSKEGLQPNHRRTQLAEFHRGFVEPHLQEADPYGDERQRTSC